MPTGITPSLAEVLRAALDSRMDDVQVALPGRVVAYHAGSQTVDVQPLVRRPLRTRSGDVRSEDLPVLPNVPVAFMRGGGFFLTFPLAADDTGLILFTSRDMAGWRTSGALSDAQDLRTHNLTSALFLPGLHSVPGQLGDPDDTNAMLGASGGTGFVRVRSDRVEVCGNSDAAALASRVNDIINAIVTTTVVPGDGGAAIKAAVAAVWSGFLNDVGSLRLKVGA